MCSTNTVISHKLWYLVFQPLVKFKNHLYYEEKDSTTEAEKVLKPAPGSKVSISVNELGCFAQLLLTISLDDLYFCFQIIPLKC